MTKYVPVSEEHRSKDLAGLLVEYLSDGNNVTPNNILEGIASAKTMLRGIHAGHYVVCQVEAPDKGKGKE